MNMQAIGFIETKGLISAIAGADAMTKAANVEIVGNKYYKVKSGIVTVIVTGDVGAVKVAVEIGASEAKKVGTLITSHTIARPDEFVMKMIIPNVYEQVKEDINKKEVKEIKEIKEEISKKEVKEVKEIKQDVKIEVKEEIKQPEIQNIEPLKEDKKTSKEDKKKNNKK